MRHNSLEVIVEGNQDFIKENLKKNFLKKVVFYYTKSSLT